MPAIKGGLRVLMATTVFYQPFGQLEEVPKIKERKVVGYKCKFCVEVHPTLRAICNHLRKHVQYGSVPAVKVRTRRPAGAVSRLSHSEFLHNKPITPCGSEGVSRPLGVPE